MTERDDSESEQYLWDGSGPADPEVARLEELLAPLGHRDPLRAPAAPARRAGAGRYLVVAAAAAVIVAAGAGVWLAGGGRGRRGGVASGGPDGGARAVVAMGGADAGALEPLGEGHACDSEAAPPSGQLRFAALSGAPTCGGAGAESGWLPVGVWLETGMGDAAQVQIAGIGEVELRPLSRLRLLATSAEEQRFELAHGTLHARVTAPPRMFLVETKAAVAVDLGCEYTLEVADDGSGELHVTAGYVSLERDGRESLVPAGTMCEMKPGIGPGTPRSEAASVGLVAALRRLDFEGDRGALAAVLSEAGVEDTITLWNLLGRAEAADRGRIYDALAGFSRPPPRVTREAIVAGDAEALADWREELETRWMGDAWAPLRKAGGLAPAGKQQPGKQQPGKR